mmetsp:Transcript_9298/g.11178  ORF Transcript_9298/g.11178 Transcript_9298/m.11178 type:complete len:244 (-) Transcript_9298:692-1423(-)
MLLWRLMTSVLSVPKVRRLELTLRQVLVIAAHQGLIIKVMGLSTYVRIVMLVPIVLLVLPVALAVKWAHMRQRVGLLHVRAVMQGLGLLVWAMQQLVLAVQSVDTQTPVLLNALSVLWALSRMKSDLPPASPVLQATSLIQMKAWHVLLVPMELIRKTRDKLAVLVARSANTPRLKVRLNVMSVPTATLRRLGRRSALDVIRVTSGRTQKLNIVGGVSLVRWVPLAVAVSTCQLLNLGIGSID